MSTWDDPQLSGTLSERIATDLRDMAIGYEGAHKRSQQTHIGPSEIGKPCTRCLARHALGMKRVRAFDDPWCRILGTAAHSWLEAAAQHANAAAGEEWWLTERRVDPHPEELPSGGSCDLYDTIRETVIDHKIVAPARVKAERLSGPGIQYRRQAHLYGLGFQRLGRRVQNVAVAFWPRGGRLADLYVWTEPYDAQIALDAISRYRTIREQAVAIGPGLLPLLPADPDCWDCGGEDVTPEELASCTTPAQTIPA